LTDEQLGCVVAHEIAHYLRCDHWTNLLSLLIAAVCWWNPVVWWARRELRIAQEACCDALVISRSVASRRKYAETLFSALEFLQTERSLMPALASGFGDKSSTERRFEMIANPKVSHRLSWWSYPVLFGALAVLPCLPSFTQAQDRGGLSQAIQIQSPSGDQRCRW
jgi:beta-lactamase regulating signal transducer with metallopeptidase domain